MGENIRFRRIKDHFFIGTNGIIIIFDLSRTKTFENVVNWVAEFKGIVGLLPFVLVGNKADLERRVQIEEIKPLIDKFHCKYIETSVKTGELVQEPFHAITQLILAETQFRLDIDEKEILLNRLRLIVVISFVIIVKRGKSLKKLKLKQLKLKKSRKKK